MIIFILGLIGIYFGLNPRSLATTMLDPAINTIRTSEFAFVPLTLSNINASLMIMAGGILFSVALVGLLIFNGLIVTYAGLISQVSLLVFLGFILPHGIFEFPAFIFACTFAFMLTHVICRIIKGVIF